MASIPRQGDPRIDFDPDPVHGFAYCRELPPDVPPGMTLDEWRHAHHRGRRHHHLLPPRAHAAARRRGGLGCHFHHRPRSHQHERRPGE